MLAAALVAGLSLFGPSEAASPANVFIVANYPVQAKADDAVTAKQLALADGQQAAFRALMKRLVPVTEYKRLPNPSAERVQQLMSGFSVRKETNSSTEYVASLDFEFQPRAVRDLLRAARVAIVETPAPEVVLVATFRAGKDAIKGQKAWLGAWSELDLVHTITPLKVRPAGKEVAEETIAALVKGDLGVVSTFARGFNVDSAVLAHATPSADGNMLEVTLAGRDAVGVFHLKRSYRISGGDIDYASEYAAVIALGVIEGRWKFARSRLAPSDPNAVTTTSVDGEQQDIQNIDDKVLIQVEFRGAEQWQQIRTRLLDQPGVDDLVVSELLSRGAQISLRYSGGGARLAEDLAAVGLELVNSGRKWTLRLR
ncbi:MAG: DUF2066 domain-containing protein [Hyphomicrobiaceae bacterium]|nr:MAG: DUF2066 domain-containing protein [Hyphomicrobiaceae bacterium]